MLAPDEGTSQLSQQWDVWAGTSVLPTYSPLIEVHLYKYTWIYNTDFTVRAINEADSLGESKILHCHSKILYRRLSAQAISLDAIASAMPFEVLLWRSDRWTNKKASVQVIKNKLKVPNTALSFSSIFCKVFVLIWSWEFYLKFISVHFKVTALFILKTSSALLHSALQTLMENTLNINSICTSLI